jgi:hypothetical protein
VHLDVVEVAGDPRQRPPPREGQELHRDERGALAPAADLGHELVPGAGAEGLDLGVVLVEVEQVLSGPDLARPRGTGEVDALVGEHLSVGDRELLEVRRPGLHEAHVDEGDGAAHPPILPSGRMGR